MNTKPVSTVLPHEVHDAIINYFFTAVNNRKGGIHDVFGVDALSFLIGTLEATGAPSEKWNAVANFVLNRSKGSAYYMYTGTLLELSPYVSLEMRERLVAHFVQVGGLKHVLHITTAQLHRVTTQEEIIVMAKYHHNGHTPSEDAVWGELLLRADTGGVDVIKQMIAEVRHEEDNPPMY